MIGKFVLHSTCTFEDVVRELDKTGEGFLPIVEKDNSLIGVVTDGDIRRAFLNKETNLDKIINKSPLTAKEGISKSQAIFILKKNHRRHLPIINNSNELVDVIKIDNWEETVRPNKVIIMAGGLGSRLGVLTKELPKPMLPLGGKPMLELLIKSFMDYGFHDFLISVNYKSEIIKNYFKDGSGFGITINYIEEKERLGTAGALSLIYKTPDHPFFVINGDILTSIDYGKLIDFHIAQQAFATMCVKHYEHQIPFATIDIHNQNIVAISEKPTIKYQVNSGIYVLSPKTLELVPKNAFFDMPTLFEKALEKQHIVKPYILSDYWKDIGNISDYNSAKSNFE